MSRIQINLGFTTFCCYAVVIVWRRLPRRQNVIDGSVWEGCFSALCRQSSVLILDGFSAVSARFWRCNSASETLTQSCSAVRPPAGTRRNLHMSQTRTFPTVPTQASLTLFQVTVRFEDYSRRTWLNVTEQNFKSSPCPCRFLSDCLLLIPSRSTSPLKFPLLSLIYET